jgi:biotin carboxylase
MASALLVDTGFSAWPILRALEKRGLEVHVVGAAPSDALARFHNNYHGVDYSDHIALSRLIDNLKPDYLVPGCNDRSYLACAAIAQDFEFSGIDSIQNAEVVNNKDMFRKFASQLGMSVPRVINWPAEPVDVPVIVKPVDAFSGKGITLLRDADQEGISVACQTAKSASRAGSFIIEQFVEGQLYSHSAFLVNHRIVQDFWVAEYSSVNPFVVDTSHLALELDPYIKAAMRTEVERFASALGLVDGLFHSQFIVSGDSHAIVEVTRRCPGDLYSQLIELSTGFEYSTAYLDSFVGVAEMNKRWQGTDSAFILRHTITGNNTATLSHLCFHESLMIERWVPLAVCGDPLESSPQGRIGILFIKATSFDDLLHLAATTLGRDLYDLNYGNDP